MIMVIFGMHLVFVLVSYRYMKDVSKAPKFQSVIQYTTHQLWETNKAPTVNVHVADESDANDLDSSAPSSANKSSQKKII